VMPSVVSRTSFGFRDQCRWTTVIFRIPISPDHHLKPGFALMLVLGL
jgi:hypothetical protein